MAKRKKEGPARSNTGSSIRGKISAPIPIDDEFPIRSPGTGIATRLGNDGLDMQGLRYSMASDRPASVLSRDMSTTFSPARQSYEAPLATARRAPQPSGLRSSELSMPTSPDNTSPQRKKSTFKSAFSKIFGKKQKSAVPGNIANGPRHEQHRSVSLSL